MIQVSSRMIFFLSSELFPILLGLTTSFNKNSERQSLCVRASWCWNDKIILWKMDQKFPIGGTIGYADSYLNFVIRYSRVSTLPSILHGAVASVRSDSGKEVASVTWLDKTKVMNVGSPDWLLFCFYVKLILFSKFFSVSLTYSTKCTGLFIEPAGKTLLMRWKFLPKEC